MCHQISLQERDRLAQMRGDGASQKEIAQALKRSPSTISREIHRNSTNDEYLPGQAHRLAEHRRRDRPLERKMDHPDIHRDVRSGLAQEWSPAQIAGRLKVDHPNDTERQVSPQTIYNWIENDESSDHWKKQLRRRGRRPARKKTVPHSDAARIHDRPEAIEQRWRLGDFEGDTVLGPPGTGGLATLVDRKSRFTIAIKIQSKDADHVHSKLKQRLLELDESRRQSITFDNGTEFARCHRLEKHLEMKLYFADPGCPYQRGTNENTNGLIRQYFPKGTKFHDITHAEVRTVENRLNRRPRQCLGYQTPDEVFHAKTTPVNCD